MAIGNVELNRAMTGVQDFVTQKHNEQQHPVVDQSVIKDQFQKEIENKLQNVRKSENAENRQKKFDARDKGSNEYTGDGGKNKSKQKKNNEIEDGRVRPLYNQFFDSTI